MQKANCQQTGLNLVLITSAWGCFKTPYVMLFISPDIAIALSSMICINQESIYSSPFWKPYLQHSSSHPPTPPSDSFRPTPWCKAGPCTFQKTLLIETTEPNSTAKSHVSLGKAQTSSRKAAHHLNNFTIYPLLKRGALLLYPKTSENSARDRETFWLAGSCSRSTNPEAFTKQWKLLLGFETSLLPGASRRKPQP